MSTVYNMESISLCWSIRMLLYNTFKSKQVCKEMITGKNNCIMLAHTQSTDSQ